MPRYKCPFPDCTFETDDVQDSLAAVLISVHSAGTQTAAAPSTGGNVAAKVEKVCRPTISTAGSSEDWSYFLTRWQDYVDATKITGKDKVVQLLECCDEQLQKDLTWNTGSLTTKPIEDVMSAIRKLAVWEENTIVARVQLHNMDQDRDETVTSFCARLRGQAGICKFTTQCSSCDTNVNYTEHILRDVLTRGLADSEIQLDLLGDKNQDMTPEEVLQFVEAKESGKRSAGRLLQAQGADAARSQYRSAKNTELKNCKLTNPTPDLCHYCGKHGHGKNSPARVRKLECPAYGKHCDHCGRANHFGAVCQAKSQPGKRRSTPPNVTTSEAEGAVFDALCMVNNSCQHQSTSAITLDHHLYNDLNDCWVWQKSQPQPLITLTATLHPDDYKALGFQPASQQPQSIRLSAMADTGCQSYLASTTVLRRLGLNQKDLIPVTTRMHAANNSDIKILGAIILRFSGTSQSGQTSETRQIVYITNDSNKLFLSRETCTALGIISGNFPTVGEAPQPSTANEKQKPSDAAEQIHLSPTPNTLESAHHQSCNCPHRTAPPTKPTQPPFPATEENRQHLQEWLLDYYKSSTFNTCEHQQLPLMDSVPMWLMIDPEAEPVAHHTPVPVPLHWQEDVKAGLDHDVSLGVLEPVPVGEPVTWCHRMVVCAKKNGKPHCTVDFQALNRHATRETHQAQSPFHQARMVPHNTKKTVFDCCNGYQSIPLHKDDYHLTTFITPWGQYHYKTAPQGYIASGDGFSRRFDEIVSHVLNKTKCVDNTLHWSDNPSDSFTQAVAWLDLCGCHGIILNPDKFVLGADTVEFAGFEITLDNVRPCRKFLDAICNFPTPANLPDMRSWFGLINQVSYAYAITDRMLPFHQLLKPGTPFHWNDTLNQLFEKSKAVTASEIEKGVRIFDKSKPTCLATDWSKSGIGFWLFQKHCECASKKPFCCPTGWKIALVGSRFTHPAESRYAPVEGEALAVADALDKHDFLS